MRYDPDDLPTPADLAPACCDPSGYACSECGRCEECGHRDDCDALGDGLSLPDMHGPRFHAPEIADHASLVWPVERWDVMRVIREGAGSVRTVRLDCADLCRASGGGRLEQPAFIWRGDLEACATIIEPNSQTARALEEFLAVEAERERELAGAAAGEEPGGW